MEVLILSGHEVNTALSMAECIEVIDRTMRTISRRLARLPARTVMALPREGDLFAVMPGFLEDPCAMGSKLIAVYPRNPDHGRSSHIGVLVMFDAHTGAPMAFIDAAAVTALRTAAASAVATRALSRPDSGDLAILGTGEQADMHLRAMALVRTLRRVRIWGRSPEKAMRLADLGRRSGLRTEAVASLREAVLDADLICTTTAAQEPVLYGEWVAPGAHINLVGAAVATAREADDALVARSRFFVDFREAALAQAGEFRHAVGAGLVNEDHILGEIGEVLDGKLSGRRSDAEITIYKSLGSAAQDLAVGQYLVERSRAEALGTLVNL
jgi:ornithine cyclodeaminase/alanine dehydrogenase-like protein (mu-crystallin family)